MQRGLALEWRRWLIENLLLGVDPPKLASVLVKSGLSKAAARAAIDREIGDPCFRGGYRATSMQRKLEGLMDAYGELHRQAPWHQDVERRDARSIVQRRPAMVRDALPALAASGALRLRAPRVWLGGSTSPRQAKTDLLLYQVLGKRPLALIPWCDFLAVRGRIGERAALQKALQLRVSVEAGEALLIPVGWWYRPAGRAGGIAVCYEAGEVRERDVAVAPTAPPLARA